MGVKFIIRVRKNTGIDDPVFIVSNIDDGIGLLYRLRIEEAFRDMKSLYSVQ